MNDTEILQRLVLVIIGYLFSCVCYYMYLILYVKKGIRFLNNTKEIIFQHKDKEEFDKIATIDIPILINLKMVMYCEIFLTFILLSINMVFYLFTLVPESQSTNVYTFLMYISSIGTAYIFISSWKYFNLQYSVNAICGSYYIILESYKYIKEYEDKDNDSTDGL